MVVTFNDTAPELMGGKVQDFIRKWRGKWRKMKPAQKALALILLGPTAPIVLGAAVAGAVGAAAAGPVILAARIKKAGGVKAFVRSWKGKWKSMNKAQRALAIALLGPMAPALLAAAIPGAVALAPGLIPHAQIKAVQAIKRKRAARKAAEAAAAQQEQAAPEEAAPGEAVEANVPVEARTEAGRTEAQAAAEAGATPEGEVEPAPEGAETAETPKKGIPPLAIVAPLMALPFIL